MPGHGCLSIVPACKFASLKISPVLSIKIWLNNDAITSTIPFHYFRVGQVPARFRTQPCNKTEHPPVQTGKINWV